MQTRFIAIVLLFLFAGAAPAADDGIHVLTLENGLKIVVKEDHSKPLAALRIYVRTGGAFEMDFLGCGISHYYEHLLSGGTTRTRPEAESSKILMKLGGQSNAYTSSDHTCYHIVTHRDFIDQAISLYGDWMINNILDPKEVEREKGVILKEFNMGEDEPRRVLYKLFAETMYREHPLRVPNIGYRENFERITREDLVRYLRNHYAPNNAVVAIAGDVDPARMFEAVEREMGAWERRPVPVVILPDEPRQSTERYAEAYLDVQQAWVRIGYHTIDLFHEDLYALDMVAAVLGNGRSSRLFRRVVEQEQLTAGIEAYSYTPAFMKGAFGVVFQTPVEELDRALAVVGEEIDRIQAGPVTQEELSRARVLAVSQYEMARQSVEDQAAEVGRALMNTGDPRFHLKYTQRIQAVTPAEVVAAARKYLPDSGRTVAVLKPHASRVEDEGSAAGGQTRIPTELIKLDNGVRVLVKRIPGITPIAVEVFCHGGLRAEPEGKNGVSWLAGRLLIKGTAKRSAKEIVHQVEDVGASLSSQGGNNTIGLSMTLPRGRRDLAFAADLLGDILGGASFPEAEFAKERQLGAYLSSRQDENWQQEVFHFMRRELFESHPYSKSTLGTPGGIMALTREDVVGFAGKTIHPSGMVVAVAGDVDVAETKKLLEGALGSLSGAGGYAAPAPALPSWAGESLPDDRFVFMENQKRQAVLSIAFPCAPYDRIEDRAALTIMDAFTSGIGLPSGWFHTALRGGEESLVYFVHLSIFAGVDPGAIYITTQTQPELLEKVYGLLMNELARLRRGAFTDEELEIGRAMALVANPYYRQTVNDIATELALPELYGAGYDLSDRMQEAVKAVTREDVMRVVETYMKHMLVAVTGPAAVKPRFEKLAKQEDE